MLMAFMDVNRKQRIAEEAREYGESLVTLLNRFDVSGSQKAVNDAFDEVFPRNELRPSSFKEAAMRLKHGIKARPPIRLEAAKRDSILRAAQEKFFPYLLIQLFLGFETVTWMARRKVSKDIPGLEAEFIWRGFLEHLRSEYPGGERAVESDSIRLRNSDWKLSFDALFRRGKNGRVDFVLEPRNDYSRAVLALARLVESGNANRVRRCRRCLRFFYAWPRADRRECSARCKTAYWQKTPRGRAYMATKMAEYRKRQREKDQRHGLAGERLKVSKSILSGLGK